MPPFGVGTERPIDRRQQQQMLRGLAVLACLWLASDERGLNLPFNRATGLLVRQLTFRLRLNSENPAMVSSPNRASDLSRIWGDSGSLMRVFLSLSLSL